MRVLIAEDEVELAKALKFLLEKNKFTVDMVHDGAAGRARSRIWGAAVPVLMLTAKAEIEDRVAGLEAGADDYLPKPFASREFIARVKALSRRNGGYSETILSFGDVELDCNRYTLGCGSLSVRLNNKEFQLAELFFRHPHYVFSTNHLMDRIWGQDSEAGIDVVWTYIGFVRRKLREIACSVEIRTVRGAGYSLEESV